MEKNYSKYIIALLLMLNFFILFKLFSMENDLNYELGYYRNEVNNIRNDINNIYHNVDTIYKKRASIIDNYNITFGDSLNSDNLTVPVKVEMTPKEISNDLTVYMLVNEEKIVMQKINSIYTATYDANVFGELEIKAVLEKNGEEKIETLDNFSDLMYKYTLNINGGFSGNTNYLSGKFEYKGEIILNFVSSKNNYPVNISLIKEVNGKAIDENPVDKSNIDNDNYTDSSEFINQPIEGNVDLSAGDKLYIYANIQDNYGLNYKYVIMAATIDAKGKIENMQPEWVNGSIIEIRDWNGKVIFIPKYLK